MRPLEGLLLLANLLAFLILVFSARFSKSRIRYLVPIAPGIAFAQVLIEGLRWQMIPAYALSGLFLLVALLQSRKPATEPSRSKRLWSLAGFVLVALGLVVSALLPILLPVFRFPRPTGQYAIGTLTYHWVDTAREEIFTADPNDRRELMVQIWYPAREDPSAPRAPYLQDADAPAPTLARLYHLPTFIFDYFKYITTNAIPSAPVADGEPRYPVLIFLEGLNGVRQMNTFQVEELVSHGYIVAALDQPYAAVAVIFPDGRQVAADPRLLSLFYQSIRPVENAPILNEQPLTGGIIPYLAQDAVFTLEQLAALNQADPNGILTGRLDLQHTGIFGVSLGGAVVGEACRLESRLRACLVMDVALPADVVKDGLQQPTMWISRDVETMRLEGWSQTDMDETQTTMRTVFESLPGDGYLVWVPGIFHLNLTDNPYYSPLTTLLGLTGPIDPWRAHQIINAYSLAFFDKHLKGLPAPLLDGPAEQYPEVRLETHNAQ